ncbi:MAG TPA: sigma 54-interacting transcriptional regulator [Metalysinibacillus sp.]
MFKDQIKLLGLIEWQKDIDKVNYNSVGMEYKPLFEQIKANINEGTTYFCLVKEFLEINVVQDDSNPNKYYIFLLCIDNNLKLELEEVINSSFDGIVIVDSKGKILYQNPAYERITGLSTEYCVKKNLQELVDDGIIDMSASLKVLEEKRSITINQKIKTGKNVLVSAVPIFNKKGGIIKVVNNVRDLTQLGQLESEIQQLEMKNKKIKEELEQLKSMNYPEYSLIAYSPQMKEVLDRALRIAQIDSGVLIQGPSGVGKEKILDLIHTSSFRKNGPLIKINCGAIPENLLESELFGYESGAFTGATKNGKVGLFEVADKGTIFLDEIGEMPLQLQVKLLRVLQEREVVRIGGKKAIPIDTRIIAATNKDLIAMIEQGTFREDLYYRLNIIPIKIPPLNQRKEDITPLVFHFVNHLNLKYGLNKSFDTQVLDYFVAYDWLGNVRELQNIVERVVLMSPNDLITMVDVKNELNISHTQLPNLSTPHLEIVPTEEKALKEQLESYEKTILKECINDYPSIRKAAIALKLDQSTLVRKLKKYNITVK